LIDKGFSNRIATAVAAAIRLTRRAKRWPSDPEKDLDAGERATPPIKAGHVSACQALTYDMGPIAVPLPGQPAKALDLVIAESFLIGADQVMD
jgi:hypothetical protein